MLAALLFAVPLAAFVASDTGILESERRQMAAFPKMSKFRGREVKSFFRGVDAFFADRFPLRSRLLGLSMAMHELGGDSLDIDRCYRGKENWLFLGNSYNRCVDKLIGRENPSDSYLKQQTEAYGRLRDVAAKSGAEFFVFIGPNKSSIYPEYLPPEVIPAKRRFISPLLDSLKGTGVKVYDPTARLIERKAAGLLYYRTDTHWNAIGAYEAFAGFSERAGLPALPSLSFDAAPVHRGDLVNIGGYNSFPLSVGDNFEVHWHVPPSLREEDGLIVNTHAPSDKTVWVFGDSFAEGLRPYISATFKATRSFGHKEFATAMSSQVPKPDVILWVIVERDFAEAD